MVNNNLKFDTCFTLTQSLQQVTAVSLLGFEHIPFASRTWPPCIRTFGNIQMQSRNVLFALSLQRYGLIELPVALVIDFGELCDSLLVTNPFSKKQVNFPTFILSVSFLFKCCFIMIFLLHWLVQLTMHQCDSKFVKKNIFFTLNSVDHLFA